MSFSNDPSVQANQLPISVDWPNNYTDFVGEIDNTYKRIANAVNTKEGALYLLTEQANFNRIYKSSNPQALRNGYRYVYDVILLNAGNIGAGATVNFPHNIISLVALTDIYCTATTVGGKMFGIVYPNLYVQGTDFYVTNPDGTSLKQCMVVLEYVKEV